MNKILYILCVALISFSACKKGEEAQPNNENTQTTVGNTIKVRGEASVNCTALIGISRDGQSIYDKSGVLDGSVGNYEFTFDFELESGDNLIFTLITDAGCGPAILKTFLYIDGNLVKSQAKACEVGGVTYVYP